MRASTQLKFESANVRHFIKRVRYRVFKSITQSLLLTMVVLLDISFALEPDESVIIRIEQTDRSADGSLLPTDSFTLLGGNEQICLVYDGAEREFGGFDFLIEYDASVLSFSTMNQGSIISDNQWEYFTYRFGPSGNCTGGCPAGRLRILGLAETNNFNHPNSWTVSKGNTFACIDFLVSNDRSIEFNFTSINWSWYDCSDNILYARDLDTIFFTRDVFDHIDSSIVDSPYIRTKITDSLSSFPTNFGTPKLCVDSQDVSIDHISNISFLNGGVRFQRLEDISIRGDINLNGVPYELADAMLYVSYFIAGLSVFTISIDDQLSASDVNADGIPLELADLVLLIRVITGDAQPDSKLNHYASSVTFTITDSLLSTDTELGAVLIITEGAHVSNASLLVPEMKMRKGIRGGQGYTIIYDLEQDVIRPGDFLSLTDQILGIEAVEVNGSKLNFVLNVSEDTDGDGVSDPTDNCPLDFNPDQTDSDGDKFGNACDVCPNDSQNDIDEDGICADIDNCPLIYNPEQMDSDSDGIGDECDGCQLIANPNQDDDDGDGVFNSCDNCATIFNVSQRDSDGDNVGDVCDNCVDQFNPDQIDSDNDGIGDACLKTGSSVIPQHFELYQNYPNPFNPNTIIRAEVPVATDWTISIYNLKGEHVQTFVGSSQAGVIEVEWDASNFASGVYFYSFTSSDFKVSKTMLYIK